MSTATKEYVLLSKKGLQELRQSIQQLEKERTQAILSLKEAEKTTGHDDRLDRNEKLANLENVESDLVEKRQLLAKAKLLPSKRTRMKVALGSVVDLIDQQGMLFRYTIVESIEANPSDGRISAASPLGSTLLGKNVQDMVELVNSQKHRTFQLVRIT